MSQPLQDRTWVVTGSASGIGRAIAERFAAAGAALVCADLDLDGAERTVRGIADCGGAACAVRCDVSVDADAARSVAEALARFGALHGLVNCAAVWIADGTVVDIPQADWNHSMAVNLNGAFLMSKHAIPPMIAAGGGSIVHVASQLGHTGKAGRAWYCAAKAALIQLAKVMAVDHAADNIRVNALSPGPVATQRNIDRYGGLEAAHRASGSLTLFNRLGRPEEIADAALFLASDASSFMTGADLLVDGGYTAV
jgi:NAD(P)-dependent dehydrogenase (short-subunit alcohol dehydrogenase family)